jgi:hypothetical protein
MGKWVERHAVAMGFRWKTPSKHCDRAFSMPLNPPSHAFFQDVIEKL